MTEYQDNDNRVYYNICYSYGYSNGSYGFIQWDGGSDRRLKENIIDIDSELARKIIDGTKPRKFKYTSKDGTHYGMIAQEARELLDEAGENDSVLEYAAPQNEDTAPIKDLRAISYNEYTPLLIKYVQDLRAELDQVKTELDRVKTELKQIKQNK